MEKYQKECQGCKVGEGIPYFKAWSKGWHSANLAN